MAERARVNNDMQNGASARGVKILVWVIAIIIVAALAIFARDIISALGEFARLLNYPFMRRAFVAGICVSICASLLGVSLVLKRYAMIGDGLSHVGFGAMAIAIALGTLTASPIFAWIGANPTLFTTAIVILAAIALLKLPAGAKLRGDAAIAMISTGALALGVCVLALSGSGVDISGYLFGSILAVTQSDMSYVICASAGITLMYIVFYRRIFAVTFDEAFARATGLRVGGYDTLLAIMTAVCIAMGMRLLGTLLISSLLIFPALTAMRLCRRYSAVVICALAVGIVCFTIGMILSSVYSLPTGAGIALTNLAGYGVACVANKIKIMAMPNMS